MIVHPVEGATAYPLALSANGRYLVDSVGVPFLLVGDTPQGLIVAPSFADAQSYIANRQAKGINAIQVHLIADNNFGGRSDLSTLAGLTPFTTAGDIATPRAAYFDYVENIINLAASAGMIVFLTAAHTYGSVNNLWVNNGTSKSYAFGQWLGTRFGSKTNIIWNHGNDFSDWGSPSINDPVIAVANGIRNTAPSHLQTAWLDQPVSSPRDSSAWNAVINVDFAYSYAATYDRCLDSYALSPAKPVHFGEGNYEGEGYWGFTTAPRHIRKQAWWAMTAGCHGHVYGNTDVWNFKSGWLSRLNSYTGLAHVAHVTSFFTGRSWWLLVPDTSSSHTVMTAGYGTYVNTEDTSAVDTNTYATCARASDGSFVVAYIPAIRQVTIDMTKVSSSLVRARWYDPTNGVYSTIAGSPFSNTGTRQFTPPGTNSNGDADWVLVLEATAGETGIPLAPQNLRAE